MRNSRSLSVASLIAALVFAIGLSVQAQLADVTQPGDPIVATSNNSPGSEGVANAIDNQPTKYLNFDKLNTGFTVTPGVGLTVVQCLALTSANDAPERDPASYTLEGSYDGTNFTMIASGPVPAFATRFQRVVIAFTNNTPYLTYRLIFPTVANEASANSMQISEVELLGFLAPSDVTQPGDPIVATSNNSPGSEGVANAIDNQPTKYLNFDRLNTGFTVTPSVGGTLVSGITLTSANDAPERDPATYRLEGSLDGTSFFEIASGSVPPFPARFYKNYIFFPNARAYRAYRLVFPEVVGPGGNSMQISEVELLGVVADVPQDVTLPGDPIVATSNNSPGSEGVANAIDNQPTKYLNFDRLNTGFTVSPSAGLTIVSGLTLTSANDAPERDPATYTLEGSYDSSNFVAISSGSVPMFTNRFHKVTILFDNKIPYLQYRLIFPEVVGPGGNSMQISEVELLGVLAPTDVTVPGDPIVATSNNSPGSEGVANAIDNQPTKYLNFDRLNTGFTVTPGVGDTIVIGLTLTSANDAPERDPASFTLSGSNDGSNYVAISAGPVPPFPARFYKNYIFFPDNTKSFKSYRLIFPEVAGPGGNSMQISEVEFLGVTPGVINTNEVDNLIRRQPQDTPVLLGSTATFRVGLTGPWKVQWYRNGVAIPGANNAVYTTPPTTAADDGALFQALVQGRDGRQLSDEVMLSIFTPSTTESVGLSWVGSGANGAPTEMLPVDITGFHPQAYWNNLSGGAGGPAPVTTSSNVAHPTIMVTWATSGEWGAGTGEDDPLQRMLNGMVTSFGTTPAAASTVTLSGVPPGSHSVLLYAVQVPQEFFNMNFEVVTHGAGGTEIAQLRYIRPLNADEYNPSPGFSLVTSDTAATRGVGNMLRFDNVTPGSDGIVEIRFYSPGRVDLPGGDPIRGPGLNGLQLVLNPPPVPEPPVITRQPVSANAIEGGQVTLLVEATGPGITYQWLRNGQAIEGATGPELTLSGLTTADAGDYAVAISNPAGRVLSRTAVVDVLASGQPTFGLITYFKLDETSGTVADNTAAGGQDGEVRGFFQDWIPGQIDNALGFDGVTRIFVPNYPKPTAAMTVAGWVQSSGSWGPIINNWIEGQTTGSSGQFLVDVVFVDDPILGQVPTLQAQIESGPNRVLASGVIDATPDVWHHFAMSANGVTLSIYWDGQLVGAVDYLGSINMTPSIPWLSIGAELGADPNADPLSAFSGVMDDLAIWNRSLSEVEIQGIYSGGLAGMNISEIPPILNINRSPVANNDTATTAANTAVTIDVVANDTDPDAGDVLSISSVTQPAHGSAVITTNNTVIYTPAANYAGPDSFNYNIGDGHGGVDSATVEITVTMPANQCPTATPSSIVVNQGGSVDFQLMASDPDGDALQYSITQPPAHGNLFLIVETGAARYSPNAGYCGADSFKFKVNDGTCDSAEATVSITVTNCNECPTASDQSIAVNQNGSVNFQLQASDPENDALQYTITQPPAHGVVVLQVATGAATYSPNAGYCGPDSFKFKVNDGHCGDSAEATVSIMVNCVTNLPPVADASATVTNVISGNNSNALVHLDGTRSSDPDGDTLTYSWFVDGGALPIATGAAADVVLEVGEHIVTLVVSDGIESDSDTIPVRVLTASEAIDDLILKVNDANTGRPTKRPLIATLKAGVASFDRGSIESGLNQLRAFQNKVRAQIVPTNPALADNLIACAQAIIDAVENP